MSGLVGNPFLLTSAGAAGYQISRSLRFNSADSAYLSRTPASAGNRQNWTWSGWVKRSNPDTGARQVLFSAYGASNDTGYFEFGFEGGANLGKFYWTQWTIDAQSTAVFRDFSAWYHIVVNYNGSNIVVYVNGTSVLTSAKTGDLAVNGAFEHGIGRQPNSGRYFSGYLANVEFVDGSALTPSSFAETNATTGQWVPKAYTGSYGTNGFRLDFSDNSAATATTLGKDRAGSNNWTPNNLSVTAGAGNDSLVDTPTSYGTDTGAGGEVRGNYATLNPLRTGGGTLSNGNLDSSLAVSQRAQSTISVNTGKWYCEFTLTAVPALVHCGLVSEDNYIATYLSDGQKSVDNSTSAYGSSYTSGDVVGCAIDIDAKSATFYKNGASQGSFNWSGSYSIHTFAFESRGATAGTRTATANFGQRPFAYTAPSGFKALCDTNLPAPVVAKPNSVFDVALWTGNGSARSITGLNFNPDFVWIKGRSGATDHALYDALRGATIDLISNSTAAETTQTQGLTAFNSDGFSLGTLAKVNTNTATYAGWAWDAGSSTVTNTQGSITSQVRANASAGFSIVTWSYGTVDATVGHGLGVAPSMIIAKARTGTSQWIVYHSGIGTDQYIYLSSTAAAATNIPGVFSSNSSTVFEVNSGLFPASVNYVAYCFAPVAGYTSAGSYTGNGSADGPFVYTSMRPRWILLKRTDSTGNWTILDTAREGYNVDNDPLFPNLADAEGTADLADILSNGFKLRSTDASVNASGGTYIYYAISETAFQYSRAR